MTGPCLILAIFCAGAATGALAARSRCVPGSYADHELRDLIMLCAGAGLAALAANAGIAIAGALP